jgi:hypothetical protein
MTTQRCAAVILSFALFAPVLARAQATATAPAANPVTEPASAAKAKRIPRARVTGGPGYVSEGGKPASGAAASAPTKRVRARVTGGPGGTAP